MNKKIVVAMLSIASGLALPAMVSAYSGEELAGQAGINMQAARDIALKAYPGTIVDRELEKEQGGSGLRYSFVISSRGVQHEVGIDARDGKVLENSPEGANAD